jgi:hypothetical protein
VTLEDARAHPGRKVVYRAWPKAVEEPGKIIRVTGNYVMVEYAGGQIKATPPDSLSFA